MALPNINDYTSIGIPGSQSSYTDELFVLSAEEVEIISKLEENTALLVEHKEGVVEARYLLNTDSTLIGRNESADILLDDNTISRKHAEIIRQSGVWSLKDLGSLNGTYVNGERIENSQVINSGDKIQIGKFHLVFFAPGNFT
ncbi:MAG: FHA domain-containing protein [Bifidobacteriaceae bacterium]|jgi:pSer/pThr/pTyr-binding forkhead associated (FHA) protein|nr:FHA domain-containing protein [Bifidobacteriaceae bacterium]